MIPDFLKKNYQESEGIEITDEILEIRKRANKLSIKELDELSRLVGIDFGLPEGQVLGSKDSYVYSLDEADDLKKVYDFLDKHGV